MGRKLRVPGIWKVIYILTGMRVEFMYFSQSFCFIRYLKLHLNQVFYIAVMTFEMGNLGIMLTICKRIKAHTQVT